MNDPSPTIDTRPLGYSYIRFSTPEQRKGDSLTRQLKLSREFCEAHGLRLAEEMQALGVSAFRGKNLDDTQILGQFLNRIKDGKIPRGSVLVVESFDRISRDKIMRCVSVLQDILFNGVGVAPLSFNGTILTEESVNDNPWLLIQVICEQIRGHNESKVKSERITEAFLRKRSAGELCGTVKYGTHARYCFTDGFALLSDYVLPHRPGNDEVAPLVAAHGPLLGITIVGKPEEQKWKLYMEQQRALGCGFHTIAKQLNELGVPTKRGRGQIMRLRTPGDAAQTPNRQGELSQADAKFTSGKWQAGNVAKVLQNKTTQVWLASREQQQQKAA